MIKFQARFHFFANDKAQTESIYSYFIKAHNTKEVERKVFRLITESRLVPDNRVIDEINIRRIKRVAGEYHTKRK